MLLVTLLASATLAHESCCAKKARLAKLQFIPDASEKPPDFDSAGNPRLIPLEGDVEPEGWDEDDDGPWEPADVANPAYSWSPRLIPNPDYNPPAFLDSLRSEILKALPWVVLGICLTAALALLLEASVLPAHKLGAVLNGAGPLGGAALGLITPLCSCGALPVAAGFISKGVPLGTVIAFLTASQSAGLDSAAITWGLLGPRATICRLLGATCLATAAGLAAGRHRAANTPTAAGSKQQAPAIATKTPFTFSANPLVALCKAAVTSAADVAPPVLLGLGLSTAAVHWLPSLSQAYEASTAGMAGLDGVEGQAGWWLRTLRNLLTRGAVIGSSLPLQLCEHSTVTAAAGIQKAGGGAGLAFAFLLVAPAVNLPSLLLLVRASQQPQNTPPLTKGRSGAGKGAAADRLASDRLAAARVALTLVVISLALSYAVDAWGVDLLVEQEAEGGGASAASMDLPAPLVHASPWLAALLAMGALGQQVGKRWGAVRGSQRDPSKKSPTGGDEGCGGGKACAEGVVDSCCKEEEPPQPKAMPRARSRAASSKSPARKRSPSTKRR